MDCNNVINFMNQQLKALKEIEDLVSHDENQASTHSIETEDLEALKTYVETMKRAAATASELAKHYKKGAQKDTPDSGTDEKPKKKRASAKKQEEPAQKPVEEQPEQPEQPEETAAAEEDEFDFLM
ncbi:hypothetical protein [Desulforamulus ruminis]|uniref:Uncharacterized protein n=1 Tax=Desulforamulus ruminis (strain ATCC 23193 / DSM 2154 / NCIMB 8452 / DL) TaxID=696281 RepID=F6DM13_DESRL|nr:hypothetical protein [Desulforamulus ruminis]AEG59355.1 hypothetical protein Desru_1080 [Desulforamulus ruminis DSM 2154]